MASSINGFKGVPLAELDAQAQAFAYKVGAAKKEEREAKAAMTSEQFDRADEETRLLHLSRFLIADITRDKAEEKLKSTQKAITDLKNHPLE